MTLEKLSEGRALFYAPVEKVVSRRMQVFYNPRMKVNRDMTVLLLRAHEFGKPLRAAEPLAGTGVRSIRLLRELPPSRMEQADLNDASPAAAQLIRRNIRLNRVAGRAKVSCGEASLFLLSSTGYGYIDIDPFGYPGRFLPAAVQRIARGGILGVTATDLSALAGSAPRACLRKYWAKPLRTEEMHETGLRILVRFVQLAGMQHEKALTPLLCYYSGHYFRAFFQCQKGKGNADRLWKQHGYFVHCSKCLRKEASQLPAARCRCGKPAEWAGPLWLGPLQDRKLLKAMEKDASKQGSVYSSAAELLRVLAAESKIKAVGFYDTNRLAQAAGVQPPAKQELVECIRKAGFRAALTHFSPMGIKTDMPAEKLVRIAKGLRLRRR